MTTGNILVKPGLVTIQIFWCHIVDGWAGGRAQVWEHGNIVTRSVSQHCTTISLNTTTINSHSHWHCWNYCCASVQLISALSHGWHCSQVSEMLSQLESVSAGVVWPLLRSEQDWLLRRWFTGVITQLRPALWYIRAPGDSEQWPTLASQLIRATRAHAHCQHFLVGLWERSWDTKQTCRR